MADPLPSDVLERETQDAWHALAPEEALRRLASDSGGVTTAEATLRLARYG